MSKKLSKKIYISLILIVLSLTLLFLSPLKTYPTFEVSASETQNSYSSYGGDNLNENPKELYDHLKPKLISIGKGELEETTIIIESEDVSQWKVKKTWTKEDLGVSELTISDVQKAFLEELEVSTVITALLHDLPYDLYWFDKTQGYSIQAHPTSTSNTSSITFEKITMKFQVTKEYQPNPYDPDNPSINRTKASETITILNEAKEIVEEYKNVSDYQKLLAYKNKICELVSYNEDAVSEDYLLGYGSPWQTLYVFDNNTSTNVVCEGYAKAFQLLCNLTDFADIHVKCYTITGVMTSGTGAGEHMWNIVTLDDEKNYIVDVTNSDTGTVGQLGQLFLTGTQNGSINIGYTFNSTNFIYADTTTDLFGSDEQSILNISATNYTPDHPTITLNIQDLVYNKETPTVGLDTGSYQIEYSFEKDEHIEDNYTWDFAWFSDYNNNIGNKLTNLPINAGKYWLKITATNKTLSFDTIVHSEQITISPKPIEILDITASNKIYDGTTAIQFTDITIYGAFDNADIKINADANIQSANVGTYKYVNLTNITISGQDKNNYSVSSTVNNIPTTTDVTITKSTPTCECLHDPIIEDGKTLGDLEVEISGAGVLNEKVTGTFIWIDNEGNELPSTTIIEKGKSYKYKFTPTDTLNYNEQQGEVILYEEKEPTLLDKFNEFINNKTNQKYLIIGGAGLLVLIILIAIIKKKKNR
ncbi:MAG: hypothetical protein E7345_02135 [Clostridiales bacterium]|nr:hypothetical protein [Clostridiales bacterium]